MQHSQRPMNCSEPSHVKFVYKRRNKSSEFDKVGKEAEKGSNLVPSTPIKRQITQVYTRRVSTKFQKHPLITPVFQSSTSSEVFNTSRAKESGIAFFEVSENGFRPPADVINSSTEHCSRGCDKNENACMDGRSLYSLGSITASNAMLELQDIDGLVHSKEDTMVDAREKSSSDKGIDDDGDGTFVINKESSELLNASKDPAINYADRPSHFLVSNDKQMLEENCFFAGDQGFILLKSAEPDKDRVDSHGVDEKEDKKCSATTPKKRAKKRSHRPRIVADGTKSRKTPKVNTKRPATFQKKTVSRKRKKDENNEAEVVEPQTPEKENSSERRKNEKKSKHEMIFEPTTPISLDSIIGVKEFSVIHSSNVVRVLNFDQECQPSESNLITPPVHVHEHDDFTLVRRSNEVGDQVIDETEQRTKVSGDQKYPIRRSGRLLQRSKFVVPTFPKVTKRRMVRKPRIDISYLVRMISIVIQEKTSRKSYRRRNKSKIRAVCLFTWERKSKRSARVHNMRKWAEIPHFNQFPKRSLTLPQFHKTTGHAQEDPNRKSKESLLLLDQRNLLPAAIDMQTVNSHANSLFWNDETKADLYSEITKRAETLCDYRPAEDLEMPNQTLSGLLPNAAGPGSCSVAEPYPLVLNSGPPPFFSQEHHPIVQTNFWLSNNLASLDHEAAGNLYQNQCHLVCPGEAPTSNECDSRASDQNQLQPKLKSHLAELPVHLQETQSLYENFKKSCKYVHPIPEPCIFHSERTMEIQALIKEMSLDIKETNRDNGKREKKKGKGLNSERQIILLSDAAEGSNKMVPYGQQVKPKTMAKVLLDPDTINEWQLLMTNDLQGRANADAEREKKWDSEREFFGGRVDLFIKRMHLLQADRKFKQWKGSVVDSVIGVYLTQNVSDHLSSNAYMSLAAKFPIDAIEEERDIMKESSERNIDGFTTLSIEEAKENKECDDQRSEFYLKNLFWSIEEKKHGLIPMEGQKGKTPEVEEAEKATKKRNKKTGVMEDERVDWKSIRRMYAKGTRDKMQMDSVDWDAVRVSEQEAVASSIKDRGQHNIIAGRIKDFLHQEVKENGSIDLEWLRDAPPDLVKRYLLEIKGLGLKSVECIRLLGLKHIAFPVDTNVGRIAVRLGWVPLEPLPDEVQMHLLDQYPYMDSIQKYLWPRLCRLPQATLYELHYQMITFGKVFCTKRSPNCNACPMKAECKHFASAYASSKLCLPGPQDKKDANDLNVPTNDITDENRTFRVTCIEEVSSPEFGNYTNSSEPIIEMPPSPTPEIPELADIEDTPGRIACQSCCEIPEIEVNMETFKKNVHDAMMNITEMLNSNKDGNEVSKALDFLTPENAIIPMPAPRLKYYSRLRTEHVVYVLPDDHELLHGFERREPDDPSPYLLTVWQPGERSHIFSPPKKKCNSDGSELCNHQTCSYCCNIREENSDTLRGTILIPCRTAMRGSFPLNGTYFQINEVFADQQTSVEPIVFPREWTRDLQKRALYCGSSVSAIFRGLDTRRIQLCFWTGYVCVRGFHREKRIPQELARRLHTPPSKKGKKFERGDED